MYYTYIESIIYLLIISNKVITYLIFEGTGNPVLKFFANVKWYFQCNEQKQVVCKERSLIKKAKCKFWKTYRVWKTHENRKRKSKMLPMVAFTIQVYGFLVVGGHKLICYCAVFSLPRCLIYENKNIQRSG